MLDDVLHPTFNFSEAEFVQAGLLPATNFSPSVQPPNHPSALVRPQEIFPKTPERTSRAAAQHDQPGSPQDHLRSPMQQVTHRQVQDHDTVRGCNDKKHLNREHQRKFRERQKVNVPKRAVQQTPLWCRRHFSMPGNFSMMRCSPASLCLCQVQAQALKAQLASTVKELEDMKLHKQELENRLNQHDSHVSLH